MKTALRNLVVTAAVAAAVPTAVFARPCDEDRAAAVPAPVEYAQYGGAWQGREGWRDRDDRWRHERNERREAWREQERARIRGEYARLDQARADFYAAPWRRNPWRAERFERWYASQRAELDRQWNALSWYASR
ncbi:hypothetical protein [Anaeromyxobacter oryzae]|uniref:Uncharacterized protein n=1 Tax=Anaeromyxobacter oryzae TaxID=2918170 RepID=A0ABN6MSQ2_9BACT|nr:hypothetical protein [Anaeromyxobacter oryzae]BDG03986.1 hypothetical protein AMOR_29820 [Anaeromyxobacter oryzae]